MMKRVATSLYGWVVLSSACLLFSASPASAQYKPQPLNDPATGEDYFIEGAANLWFPTASIQVSSESLGQTPTLIDAKNDLGLQDKKLGEFKLTLRPSRRNKFRFQYIPIDYSQVGTPLRSIVFNGQLYQTNVPIASSLDWKAYRFAYEFDFVATNRGFGGFIVEAKYTDVKVTLQSPVANLNEFTHAQAPIPALGGIVRVYVVPNISLTGEITGFTLPQNAIKGDSGHYVDYDFDATLNFTNNIGVQAGYRAIDAGYIVKTDTGAFTLKGPYLGITARY
jgi:hypothetical protein